MIPIAVISLNEPTVPVTDALDDAFAPLDVEKTGSTDGDSSYVPARLLPRGNAGPDHVAGRKAMNPFGAQQVATRKSVFRQARALIAAAAHRLEGEGGNVPTSKLLYLPHTS